MTDQPATPGAPDRLPRTVVGLGLVSLFTDASSEAIFPLLPAFLASLGAASWFIGLLEGIADLVANLLKYVTGVAADRRARLKPFVLAGYGISTFVRPLVALAAAPWHVLAVRVFDRVGKGLRSSPRDALIATVTHPTMLGRAFGLQRALDHGGAVLGTVIAFSLLWLLGAGPGTGPAPAETLRTVFLFAAIPGFLALATLVATPEPPHPPRVEAPLPGVPEAPRRVPPALKRALGPLVLFGFANATDAFLLVMANRLGASPAYAPLLWLALHAIKAATATFGGRLADKHGKRNALVLGWLVYAVTWSAIGFASSLPMLFALAAVYGVSHGLVEGAERALVAELAGGKTRGRSFGAYNMGIGLAALAGSASFGFVLDRFGSVASFCGWGAVAAAAALTLRALVPASPARGEAPVG